MSDCKNCNNIGILREFEYKCCPKAKYKKDPYLSSFNISLCDYCYQYIMDNTEFPISGRDEYDALDGLVFPEENFGVKTNINIEIDEIIQTNIDNENENFCGICHEKFSPKTFKLSCGHVFDTECIIDWLQIPDSNGECPICRHNPHKIVNNEEDYISEIEDEEDIESNISEDIDELQTESKSLQIRNEKKKLRRYIGKLLNHELFKSRVINLKEKKKELSNKIKEKKKDLNNKLKNLIENIFTEEEMLEYKQFEKNVAKLKNDMNKKIPKDNLSYPNLTNKGEKKYILSRRVDGSLNIPMWIPYHQKMVQVKLKYPFNYLQ
jgi:hypothetical protein